MKLDNAHFIILPKIPPLPSLPQPGANSSSEIVENKWRYSITLFSCISTEEQISPLLPKTYCRWHLRAKILLINTTMEGSDQYGITGKELTGLDIPERYTIDVYFGSYDAIYKKPSQHQQYQSDKE
jgi:hypothetical protein